MSNQIRKHIPSERKLAAILFTDIVGYTSMMQANEKLALTSLNKFKQTLDTQVPAHRGEIINFYGDGCLAIFNSSVNATACAKSLQEAFQSEPKVPVRIGLHAGDIVFRDDNVFGDAVNIASRVESMGIAGAVLLSSNVRNQIRNKPEFQLASLGKFEFKNVEGGMTVYALAGEGLLLPRKTDLRGKFKQKSNAFYKWMIGAGLLLLLLLSGWHFKNKFLSSEQQVQVAAEGKPSIVILPFDNLSNDPEQEYFSDAMADEIRATLSAIDRLKVISRSSSMYFKGKQVSQKEIAQTLKVNHVLSGSVQKFEDRLKFNVELSNAQTDEVDWSMKTDLRPMKDIFDIQQELALEVARQLKVNISEQEMARSYKQYTNDPELYDHFLKAWTSYLSGDYDYLDGLQEEIEQILDKEPDFVPALSALAHIFMVRSIIGDLPRNSVRNKSLPLFLKIEAIDNKARHFLGMFGFYKFWFEWDFEGAEEVSKRGLTINDQQSIVCLIELYQKSDKLEEAKKLILLLEDLNPFNSFLGSFQTRSKMFAGELQESETYARSFIKNYPLNRNGFFNLGRLFLLQNKNQEAADILELGIEKTGQPLPYLTGYLAMAYHRLGHQENFQTIVQDLVSYWEKGTANSPAFFLSAVYSDMGQTDKAFEWLEKSFKARDVEMTWLKMEPAFEPVRKDPRYQEMLDRVGFLKD